MTKPRPRPSKPRIIHAALDPGIAILEVHRDVETPPTMPGKPAGFRLDVFELLYRRQAMEEPAYLAARRLERDYDAIHGGDRSDMTERVDCSTGGGQDDRRRAATARVAQVLAIVRPGSRRLLEALIGPQFAGILTRWRDTVETITGQGREEVQTDRVRQAAEDLADAYESIDYRESKRA